MTFDEKIEAAAKIAFETVYELYWDLLPLDTRRSFVLLARTFVSLPGGSFPGLFAAAVVANYVP